MHPFSPYIKASSLNSLSTLKPLKKRSPLLILKNMDSQNKTLPAGAINGVAETGRNHQSGRERSRSSTCDLVLRILGLVLTLAAAIVLGVDKQTKIVPVQVVDSLPPLNITAHAKWHYSSAFVFFVVSNAIACSYAALSLILSMVGKGLSPLTMILDLLIVALLFCGNGAATAIGLVGYHGNSHLQWNKVCSVFEKFCNQVAAAIVLSLIGSLVFLSLLALASIRLHKKCK